MSQSLNTLPQFKRGECLVAVIGDEDTVVGMLLSGFGQVASRKTPNFFVVDTKTTPAKIEEAFRGFVADPEVAIILITQKCASEIRYILDEYERIVPTVLEIPSKDSPYDPSKDSIVQRLRKMMGKE